MSCRLRACRGLADAGKRVWHPIVPQATPTTVVAAASRRDICLSVCVATASPLAAASPADAAAIAAKCDLITAPSGLQYCDTLEGSGDEAQAGTTIRAHYAGRLQSNGVQFDSSYDRGRPLSFKVGAGQVIKGWDQGILGSDGVPPMKAGGKRLLVIPPELGYGQRGAGGVIPPGATLVFDVEYLGLATARR